MCGSLTCVLDRDARPRDLGPVALVCHQALGAGLAGADCRQSSDCASGLCTLIGTCVTPCRTDADCQGTGASAERCTTTHVRTQYANAILENVGSLTACIRRVAVAADIRSLTQATTSTRIDAPPVPTGELAWLTVQSSSNLVTLQTGETTLFDAARFAATPGPQANLVTQLGSTFGILAPNASPSLDLATHSVRLTFDRAGPLSCVDLRRTVLGPSERASLAITFIYAATAALDPIDENTPNGRLAPVTTKLREVLALAGIDMLPAKHIRLGGMLRRDIELLEPAELSSVFTLTAGLATPRLVVFLVRDISTGRSSVLAYAPGVPGAIGVPGTAASGIAIAVEQHESDDAIALSIAHELGHFAGLYHTTELRGGSTESIASTPECPLTRDTNRDGTLAAEECSAEDGLNLMFWAGRDAHLEPEQSAIIRTSPILTAILAGN